MTSSVKSRIVKLEDRRPSALAAWRDVAPELVDSRRRILWRMVVHSSLGIPFDDLRDELKKMQSLPPAPPVVKRQRLDPKELGAMVVADIEARAEDDIEYRRLLTMLKSRDNLAD